MVLIASTFGHISGNDGVVTATAAYGQSRTDTLPKIEKGDVEKLISSSTDAQRLVNRPVRLHKVKVLTVTANNNFWAGFGG